MNIFSKELTEPLLIVEADGVYNVSVTAVGGTVLISGEFSFTPSSTGIPILATAVSILENGTFVTSAGATRPIKYLLITPVGGIAATFIFFN